MRDALGQRGEAIFTVLMTEFHSHAGPIFKPQFLGDKWQYVDFIVELVGAGKSVPYFFVQVKTTREVSANGESLKSLSSLSTQFKIIKQNRELLWQEVDDFWSRYHTNQLVSKFADRDWR